MPQVEENKEYNMREAVEDLKKTEEILEEVHEEEEEVAPEWTDTELKAMEKGWNPDKDAVPEGKEWIEADEFLRNESFFTEIRKLKRELNQTKKTFDELKEHHKKVAEAERAKVLDDLKRQKRLALEDDDHDAVIEIDDKILEVKTQKPDDTMSQDDHNELFEAWVEKNSWYETNQEMREMADDLGNAYYMRTQGKATPTQIYEHVEKQIKRIFKDDFGVKTPTRKSTPSVEGASASRGGKTKSKSKFTERDLSDDQRKVMNRFVKQGVLSKEEYIEQLIEIGELG
jgi:hypothetical protein